MRGYVLAFRPATGEGTIVTDTGDTLKFARRDRRAELHGGDIVTFRLPDAPARAHAAAACDVEVVQKWSDVLTSDDRAQVRELYSALQLDGLTH